MDEKIRILMIDDDVRLSKTVKMLLTRTGRFDVCVENNPLKATEAALAFHPDLILLDVIMPYKDGGTVAGEIREVAALSNVPVIFLTSILDKDEAAVKGNTIGNDPVLAKPVTTQELIQEIDRVLEHHR